MNKAISFRQRVASDLTTSNGQVQFRFFEADGSICLDQRILIIELHWLPYRQAELTVRAAQRRVIDVVCGTTDLDFRGYNARNHRLVFDIRRDQAQAETGILYDGGEHQFSSTVGRVLGNGYIDEH